MKALGEFIFDEERRQEIALLTDAPLLLPIEHVQAEVLPWIAITTLSLTVFYCIVFFLFERLFSKTSLPENRSKVSYQITNLSVNAVLASTGMYYVLFVLPSAFDAKTVVQGMEELCFFSSFQLGYQLWAIPVGVFIVGESVPMLCHHAAVVTICIHTGFLSNGFRYWTPFFYGALEGSSVPLAIMNIWKDNPKWVERYPIVFLLIRLVFAISFIVIRLWMSTPRLLTLLRDLSLLISVSEGWVYNLHLSVVFVCSAFLQLLQMYWGYLILRGFASLFRNSRSNSSKKAQ